MVPLVWCQTVVGDYYAVPDAILVQYGFECLAIPYRSRHRFNDHWNMPFPREHKSEVGLILINVIGIVTFLHKVDILRSGE
ncbi:MAG: hypothetical protein QW578_05130 [Thermoplasmatales archaeon]